MTRPSDPIRDPGLSYLEAIGAEAACRAVAESSPTGPPEPLIGAAEKLNTAALDDSPLEPRYSVEEIKELLLGKEAKGAAAARWDEAHAEKMARFMKSVRPGEVAQPFENSDVAGAAIEAALSTAFNGATPTQPEPITQKEAARRLGVHVNTVATMLDDGRLLAIDCGTGGGPSGTCRRVDPRSPLLASPQPQPQPQSLQGDGE